MKNIKRAIIAFALIIIGSIVSSAYFCIVNADDEQIETANTKFSEMLNMKKFNKATATTTYTVTDSAFGANGNDTKDDRHAIQLALNKAISSSNPIIVKIPKGTYYIKTTEDHPGLEIYSNTTLQVDSQATIIGLGSDGGKNTRSMLRAVHRENGDICKDENCSKGGYTQWNNITVTGGTWDCNNVDGSFVGAFVFRHGNNLTIKNLTLQNNSGHIINLSASETVTVDGVTIKNQITPSNEKDFSCEVIHIDSAAKGETSAYPQDGTRAHKIVIKNCTFENVLSGIGCHSIYRRAEDAGTNPNSSTFLKYLSTDITIQNNTFKNIKCFAINAIAFRELKIMGNVATGKNPNNPSGTGNGYAFIHTRNATNHTDSNPILISSTTNANNYNKVTGFDYSVVRYNYNLANDEKSNNLSVSGGNSTNSRYYTVYTANGGVGNDQISSLEIVGRTSFTLGTYSFTRTGYKFSGYKVTYNDGQGEKDLGTYAAGSTIYLNDNEGNPIRWHDTLYKMYAQWTALKMTKIAVTTMPKVNYTKNSTLDLSGGKITCTYEDGSTTTVDLSKATVTGFNSAKTGKQTLTVTYNGLTTTYDVTVSETSVTDNPPTIQMYDATTNKLLENEARISKGTKIRILFADDKGIAGYNISISPGLPSTWKTQYDQEPITNVKIVNVTFSTVGENYIWVKDTGTGITRVSVIVEDNAGLLGDVDGNGSINLTDVLKLRRYISNSTKWNLTDAEKNRADVNGDGKLNVSDVLKIRRYIAANSNASIKAKHPDWMW